MARHSKEEVRLKRDTDLLQNAILAAIDENSGRKIKLEAQVEVCWQLTDRVRSRVDRCRILWDDFEGRTMICDITEEKLKKYLKDFSMASYLRTLYNLVLTKEF